MLSASFQWVNLLGGTLQHPSSKSLHRIFFQKWYKWCFSSSVGLQFVLEKITINRFTFHVFVKMGCESQFMRQLNSTFEMAFCHNFLQFSVTYLKYVKVTAGLILKKATFGTKLFFAEIYSL